MTFQTLHGTLPHLRSPDKQEHLRCYIATEAVLFSYTVSKYIQVLCTWIDKGKCHKNQIFCNYSFKTHSSIAQKMWFFLQQALHHRQNNQKHITHKLIPKAMISRPSPIIWFWKAVATGNTFISVGNFSVPIKTNFSRINGLHDESRVVEIWLNHSTYSTKKQRHNAHCCSRLWKENKNKAI